MLEGLASTCKEKHTKVAELPSLIVVTQEFSGRTGASCESTNL